MLDPSIRILAYQSTTLLGPNLQPRQHTLVRYMVGNLGPFVLTLPEGQDSEQAVEQALNAKVESLRAIGALQ